jgi:outer membrane receptor for ferrienterochelin and colicin
LRNTWNYQGSKWEGQFGAEGLYQTRVGGQDIYTYPKYKLSDSIFGTYTETKRVEAFAKIGYLFPDSKRKNQSFGSQYAFTYHDINSVYGIKSYQGKQTSGYVNLIYQDEIFNDKHIIKTGLSYQYDGYDEKVKHPNLDSTGKRTESIPGVFLEYNYTMPMKFVLSAGYRLDYHNLFGIMQTPRLHIKYDVDKLSSLRLSAGKGYRTPNIFIENQYMWLSNRTLDIQSKLIQEESQNYGLSYQRNMTYKKRKISIVADYFYSNLNNQMVYDVDYSEHKVIVNQLNGLSYAHSAQGEVFVDVSKHFNIRTAYKYYEVKVTYHNQLLSKPMVPNQRVLITGQYISKYKKWIVDGTALWFGKQRMPYMDEDGVHTKEIFARDYWIFHTQITRNFKNWSVYAGSENLLNFRQLNPVLGYNTPFGTHFDATMVWGPV